MHAAALHDHIAVVRFLCDLPGGPAAENLGRLVDMAVVLGLSGFLRYVCRTYFSPNQSGDALTLRNRYVHEARTTAARTPLLALRGLLRQGRAIPLFRYSRRRFRWA